jgi:predicted CXXCH cytochrome family protein
LSLPEQKLRVVAEEYQQSVHRDERIGCVACHKGNPNDPTVQAHDPSTGFTVRPPHDQISALCGGCHEDPSFVRRFNTKLPVDQKKLFELSVHGKVAAAGDSSAPTCSDCHGTHAIGSVASPNVLANKKNVVELCGKCHSNSKHMAPYNIATDQVAKWHKSVHGTAFRDGSEAAPTCTGCHSPHVGTLPGSITIAAFCGRCHDEERELFLQSPHSRAFRRLGLGECVPCHGHHEVSHSSWLAGMSPDSACSRCHSRDDKPKRVAEEIGRLVRGIYDRERTVKLDLEQAKQSGLFVPEAGFAMTQLHSDKLRLIASVHALDLDRIKEQAKALESKAREAERWVAKARTERQVERRGYFVALAMASILFLLLVLKAAQLARRRPRSDP